MYTYQDQCHWVICILARTYVFGSSTYQDLSVNQILTRTPVHRLYIYLPGPMSLDHMYVCQDLCPWIIHLLTRTYVLGSYVYLPGPMSLDYTSTYQDLGLYIYLPGPMSLEFTYSIQDLCSWIICILTRTDIYEKKDRQTQDRRMHRKRSIWGDNCVQTGRNGSMQMVEAERHDLQIV